MTMTREEFTHSSSDTQANLELSEIAQLTDNGFPTCGNAPSVPIPNNNNTPSVPMPCSRYRYSMSTTETRTFRSRHSRCCVGAAAVFLSLLTIGIFLGIMIHFTVIDVLWKNSSSVPKLPIPRADTPLGHVVPDFLGSVKIINLDWEYNLAVSDSVQYRDLAARTEQELDRVFLLSPLKDVYNFSLVRTFRRGSIVVVFETILTEHRSLSADTIKDAMAQGLANRKYIRGDGDVTKNKHIVVLDVESIQIVALTTTTRWEEEETTTLPMMVSSNFGSMENVVIPTTTAKMDIVTSTTTALPETFKETTYTTIPTNNLNKNLVDVTTTISSIMSVDKSTYVTTPKENLTSAISQNISSEAAPKQTHFSVTMPTTISSSKTLAHQKSNTRSQDISTFTNHPINLNTVSTAGDELYPDLDLDIATDLDLATDPTPIPSWFWTPWRGTHFTPGQYVPVTDPGVPLPHTDTPHKLPPPWDADKFYPVQTRSPGNTKSDFGRPTLITGITTDYWNLPSSVSTNTGSKRTSAATVNSDQKPIAGRPVTLHKNNTDEMDSVKNVTDHVIPLGSSQIKEDIDVDGITTPVPLSSSDNRIPNVVGHLDNTESNTSHRNNAIHNIPQSTLSMLTNSPKEMVPRHTTHNDPKPLTTLPSRHFLTRPSHGNGHGFADTSMPSSDVAGEVTGSKSQDGMDPKPSWGNEHVTSVSPVDGRADPHPDSQHILEHDPSTGNKFWAKGDPEDLPSSPYPDRSDHTERRGEIQGFVTRYPNNVANVFPNDADQRSTAQTSLKDKFGADDELRNTLIPGNKTDVTSKFETSSQMTSPKLSDRVTTKGHTSYLNITNPGSTTISYDQMLEINTTDSIIANVTMKAKAIESTLGFFSGIDTRTTVLTDTGLDTNAPNMTSVSPSVDINGTSDINLNVDNAQNSSGFHINSSRIDPTQSVETTGFPFASVSPEEYRANVNGTDNGFNTRNKTQTANDRVNMSSTNAIQPSETSNLFFSSVGHSTFSEIPKGTYSLRSSLNSIGPSTTYTIDTNPPSMTQQPVETTMVKHEAFNIRPTSVVTREDDMMETHTEQSGNPHVSSMLPTHYADSKHNRNNELYNETIQKSYESENTSNLQDVHGSVTINIVKTDTDSKLATIPSVISTKGSHQHSASVLTTRAIIFPSSTFIPMQSESVLKDIDLPNLENSATEVDPKAYSSQPSPSSTFNIQPTVVIPTETFHDLTSTGAFESGSLFTSSFVKSSISELADLAQTSHPLSSATISKSDHVPPVHHKKEREMSGPYSSDSDPETDVTAPPVNACLDISIMTQFIPSCLDFFSQITHTKDVLERCQHFLAGVICVTDEFYKHSGQQCSDSEINTFIKQHSHLFKNALPGFDPLQCVI